MARMSASAIIRRIAALGRRTAATALPPIIPTGEIMVAGTLVRDPGEPWQAGVVCEFLTTEGRPFRLLLSSAGARDHAARLESAADRGETLAAAETAPRED